MKRKNLFSRTVIVLLLISSSILGFAQDNNIQSYRFISPLPGSEMILPETNIIIREGNFIDQSSLSESNLIYVSGTKSGMHNGRKILSDDNKTILFKPYNKFYFGETVTVKYSGGIKNTDGSELLPFNFQFKISESNPGKDYHPSIEALFDLKEMPSPKFNIASKFQNLIINDFPDDFPQMTVDIKNNPSPGYLFLAPFVNTGYLMIIDNDAVPIFYRRSSSVQADFKIQPNGLLTYYDLTPSKFYMMDSSYTVIDSFATGNGYTTDIHELRLLPDGHALLQAYDLQHVRMDTIVEGGDPNALVKGLIVQELDQNKNVVFQWRSWDHFQITDATEDIDLTAHIIDYVHGNAIELDTDGNLIISARHMDEITKINRQTGDIIWRWGGIKSRNNQFTFTNDTITFSHQHDIRRLPGGNLTMFDNGNLHDPRFSQAVEYQLDETNKIATKIWSFKNNPASFSFAMGSMQRLTNDNTIIGWGWKFTQPIAISEVTNNGTIAFQLSMPDSFVNYRAFRFPWRTNLFVANPDSIFFESVPPGDSATITFSLQSNSSDSVLITSFYNKNDFYSVENPVPFVVPPFSSIPVTVKFKPGKEGYFKDYLHINSDTETSRIAQVMILAGRTDSTISSVDDKKTLTGFRLEQNYPNPFNPATKIKFSTAATEMTSLKVYDLLGREVATLINKELEPGNYSLTFNGENLPSGVYLYRLKIGNVFDKTRKMLLLK